MSSVNKVILVGRLGRDPELKNINGLAIANFSLATSKQWKDDSGEKQERTEWHNVVAFKKLAELSGKYLAKGRSVYVEGELQTRSWDDKDSGQKKYRTEVIANTIQFLGDKPAAASQNGETNDIPDDSAPDTNPNPEIPF